MKIYVLKAIAALLNFSLISFVVRTMPEALVQNYLLVLGYVVLGALIVGFGIDTGLERYVSRFISACSRLQMIAMITAASFIRIGLLAIFVVILSSIRPEFIEVSSATYIFAFFNFLFTTLTSVLNGILRYTASAVANLIKASCRFMIFSLPPLGLTSLDALLVVEVSAAICATLYCLVVFSRSKVEQPSSMPSLRTVFSFLSWNYFSRLFLNFVSLNTVKVMILRSNHPNAVIYAYAIQLTESIEKFLPSLVLAGRYRPELSKVFDTGKITHLKLRVRALARYSVLSAGAASIIHLAIIPVTFILLLDRSPTGDWPLIVICSAWLFIVNMKYCLNILSNVIEANYIQFAASAVLSLIFFTVFGVNSIQSPIYILLTIMMVMLSYPIIWFGFAVKKLRALNLI